MSSKTFQKKMIKKRKKRAHKANLKADRTMLSLQEELVSTENKIAFARNNYNDWVTNLNMTIDRFPTNLIASMFGYRKADLFEIEDPSMREAPKVKF